MLEDFVIRKVEEKDIENNLLNIFIQGYNLHYTNRPDKFSKRTDERLKEILLEVIQTESLIVIEYKNRIIGYATYQLKEKNKNKILWIDELVIDDNFQGKGYGKILLNKLENLTQEEKCQSIEFCCWEFNVKAKEIYQHLGYTTQRTIFEKKIN